MEMTEFEIIKDYGEALNKAEQIDILAQLNLCSREDIVDILKKNGIPVYTGAKMRTGGRRGCVTWDDANVQKLSGHVAEGLSNDEIAERFGSSAQAISYQICSRGLRSKVKDITPKSAKRRGGMSEAPSPAIKGSPKGVNLDVNEEYVKHLEKLLKDKDKDCKELMASNVDLTERLEAVSRELVSEKCKCDFCENGKGIKNAVVLIKNIRSLSRLCIRGADSEHIEDIRFGLANICELAESLICELDAEA